MIHTRKRARLEITSTGGRVRTQRWSWRLVEVQSGKRIAFGKRYVNRDECVEMALAVCTGVYEVLLPE